MDGHARAVPIRTTTRQKCGFNLAIVPPKPSAGTITWVGPCHCPAHDRAPAGEILNGVLLGDRYLDEPGCSFAEHTSRRSQGVMADQRRVVIAAQDVWLRRHLRSGLEALGYVTWSEVSDGL